MIVEERLKYLEQLGNELFVRLRDKKYGQRSEDLARIISVLAGNPVFIRAVRGEIMRVVNQSVQETNAQREKLRTEVEEEIAQRNRRSTEQFTDSQGNKW